MYKELEQPLLSTRAMGILFRLACLAVLVAVVPKPHAAARPLTEVRVKTGDVVLQTSRSSRSALIRKASRSPYSHVGLVEVASDGVFVIEAVQPVSRTPFRQWRSRGAGGRVTVLRSTSLNEAQLERVVAAAKAELGKPYDAHYRWDDGRLYCSELVAKAFERGAATTVGRQERLKDLDLSDAELALGPSLGLDPEQTLVTPASLAEDPHFELVATDFK